PHIVPNALIAVSPNETNAALIASIPGDISANFAFTPSMNALTAFRNVSDELYAAVNAITNAAIPATTRPTGFAINASAVPKPVIIVAPVANPTIAVAAS